MRSLITAVAFYNGQRASRIACQKLTSCFGCTPSKSPVTIFQYSMTLMRYSTTAMRYSTQPANESLRAFHEQELSEFVYRLSPEQRKLLLQELEKEKYAAEHKDTQQKIVAPTSKQLRYLALFTGIPFIGFGLLDNSIMLTAGEYIDITFGAMLGITTMASAALGNMVSDVLGISTASFVEQTASKLGLKSPTLTLEQMSLKRARRFANLGRCVGVCIGCLLGMWPLLVFGSGETAGEKPKGEASDESK